jgi:hypothetical protein
MTIYTSYIEGMDVMVYPAPLSEYRDYDGSSLKIKWNVEIEGRSWGIKSISPSINSIVGTLTFSNEADNVKDIEIDTLHDLSWDIEIQQYEYKEYLAPSELEINFDKKHILVYF